MGWTSTFLEGIGVERVHAATLLAADERLAPFAEEMGPLERGFCDAPPNDMAAYNERLDAIGEAAGVHPYTVRFLFYAHTAAWLRDRFRAEGVPDGIFWDTLRDLRYKLGECLDVYDVPGTFTVGWYPRFYRMEIFALGRLQFEKRPFGPASYTKGGHTVRQGDRALSIHIPSAGPLMEALCKDAYARAHAFFRPYFKGGPSVFTCESWLLYPGNAQFLPEGNIRRFMEDFDILSGRDDPGFADAWRVFGREAGKPPAELPTDTGLRRAYAQRLQAGLPVGFGYGVILYEGELG